MDSSLPPVSSSHRLDNHPGKREPVNPRRKRLKSTQFTPVFQRSTGRAQVYNRRGTFEAWHQGLRGANRCELIARCCANCKRIFQHSCHATCRNLEAGAGPAPPEVESRIWDSHMRINSRFRKLLLHFRDEQARKKRPVEERKLKHQYLKFISGAQQFYEKYLKFILLRSKVAPELAEAAAELQIVPVDVPTPANIAQELRNTLIESCYSTFIRLGDLSRYYQTELVADPKRREWNHVVNYYALAGSIKPTSGIFHNQLAIIARAEADHLQATYYLYRALCATESHPTAPGNLEIEFRKILNARSNGKYQRKCTHFLPAA
ncbi:hypothetical protein CISG_05566 [Coccidioides immitis RMSCC 3703]|uniref:DNA/RNA-binding domain-containing protein n=1 Tax=Coccidioides immitis RMSCC 3703 TaxID=454286 RepID=A0A0J8QXV3_COCIT|nr:hypothetical protein CISG_05566 [Coccidioides immitis RMSCC 3703]